MIGPFLNCGKLAKFLASKVGVRFLLKSPNSHRLVVECANAPDLQEGDIVELYGTILGVMKVQDEILTLMRAKQLKVIPKREISSL